MRLSRILPQLLLTWLACGAVVACNDDSDPGTPAAAGSGGQAGSGGSGTTAGAAGTGGAAGATGGAGTAGAGGTDEDAGSTDAPGTGGAGGSDGAVGDGAPTTIAKSDGTWVVYADPYGDGGAMNPIAATVMGTVEAFALAGGKMRVALLVTGLPPNRAFGSHIHKLKCDDNKAGGHYQNVPFPDGGSASDPMYANAMNEVWLDFTTDASGTGMSTATVDWVPRAGAANAVMIHDMKTGDGGIAGAKLACTNLAF